MFVIKTQTASIKLIAALKAPVLLVLSATNRSSQSTTHAIIRTNANLAAAITAI